MKNPLLDSWGFVDIYGWPIICISTLVFLAIVALFIIGVVHRIRGQDLSRQMVLCFILSSWIGLLGIVVYSMMMAKFFMRVAIYLGAGGGEIGWWIALILGNQCNGRLSLCSLVALIGVSAGLILFLLKKSQSGASSS